MPPTGLKIVLIKKMYKIMKIKVNVGLAICSHICARIPMYINARMTVLTILNIYNTTQCVRMSAKCIGLEESYKWNKKGNCVFFSFAPHVKWRMVFVFCQRPFYSWLANDIYSEVKKFPLVERCMGGGGMRELTLPRDVQAEYVGTRTLPGCLGL